MKKWLLLCLACFSVTASALEPMYFGIQSGYANTNIAANQFQAMVNGNPTGITSVILKDHVFANRAYFGYQFNEFLGIESGYSNLKNSRLVQINNGAVPNAAVSLVGFDVRGKLLLPLAPYLNLTPYMQLGTMYTHANASASIVASHSNGFSTSIRTLLALGLSYNFNQNLSLDCSWTKIFKGHSQLTRTELLLMGLTYHFDLSPDNTNDNNNYNSLL